MTYFVVFSIKYGLLQEKLESQSESEQIELYEEKLKLIEAELLCSQQRADIAESQGI